ncbi:hypothetical protein PIIN_07431 [Serendipita indica DSM 11827]|uniref:F-box domain-containing protein n=1 Tax=Serendipita indica (strain DSM 11827) TaxID=1109443 RepID=G4TQ84_SERID|nr:hypothetical protein PIIN_07431 [Serendipita indica DSM 11827]
MTDEYRIAHLPVECWQDILSYAIGVPLFFDTDPFDNHSFVDVHRYSDEGPYWESERVRNRLRRVCMSWNVFLSQFHYRYICTGHVRGGHIPSVALRLAWRMRLAPCDCSRCIESPKIRRDSEKHAWSSIIETDPLQAEWNLQILDMGGTSSLELLFDSPSRLANLRVVIESSEKVVDLVAKANIPLTILDGYSRLTTKLLPSIPLENVTTLKIFAQLQAGYTIPRIPNLRHLSMHTIATSDSRKYLFDFLDINGSELITFFWRGTMGVRTQNSIWEKCPNAKSFQLPWDFQWIQPPSGHPIQHIRLDTERPTGVRPFCSMCGPAHSNVQYVDHLPNLVKAGVQTIAMGCWYTALFAAPYRSADSGPLSRFMCTRHRASLHGVHLIDTRGLTFEDVVVASLERRRQGKPPSKPSISFEF